MHSEVHSIVALPRHYHSTFLREYWTCTLRTRRKHSLNYIQHACFFQAVSNNICFLSHRTAIHSECAFSRWYPFCLPTHYSKLPQTVYLLIVTIIFFCQVWWEVLSEDNVHNCIKAHLFILHDYAATDESVCFCVWHVFVGSGLIGFISTSSHLVLLTEWQVVHLSTRV